nr:MAG TPA: hypothetical protein [Caudoviricetes sp.]
MWYNEGGNNALQKIMFPARLSCLLVADGAAFSFYGYPSVLVCINSLFSLLTGANWNEFNEILNIFKNVENVGNVGKRHNS